MLYVLKGGTNRELDSLEALFSGEFKGRIAMPTAYFESILCAAIYLGYANPTDLTDNELKEVERLLIKQKPGVRSYWVNVGDLKSLFATGEVIVAWGWAAALGLRDESPIDLRWATPKEGQLLFYNISVMTKESVTRGNADTAHALINYLAGPDYQVQLARKLQYRPSSQKAIDMLSSVEKTKLGLNDPNFLKNARPWGNIRRREAYQAVLDNLKNA
jgi:putative spermidine/putrescine transport system substrate-binding protein/spermidine/putrescine transport system substrate-binding protein